MSGTQPTFPFPSTLGTLPAEGSKYVSVTVAPGNSNPVLINLLSPFQSGRFTTVQHLFADNSTNNGTITITSLESQQNIRVPPFTFGSYPLLCGPAPEFSLLQTGIGTSRLFFLNTPADFFETRVSSESLLYSQILLSPGIDGTPRPVTASKAGCVAAISSIDLTASPFSAFASEQTGCFELFEQATGGLPNTGSNYSQLWSTQWTAPASAQNTVFYSRQLTFPSPLMQSFPGNPLWLYSTNPSVGTNVSTTIVYSLLPIA